MEGKGRGVVSTRPFSKGELVCEYSGELISLEEAQRREGEYRETRPLAATCITSLTRTENPGI